MTSKIKIKRSLVSGNPPTLSAGELAYSGLPDNGSNGGDRLYIGMGTEIAGNAANHFVIGGKFFTDRLDHTAGILTNNKALVVDNTGKLDIIKVGGLTVTGSSNEISSANSGNIVLNPGGTGRVNIANAFSLPRTDGVAGYALQTDGAGNVTWQPVGVNTATVTQIVSSLGYITTASVDALIANSLTNYATVSSLNNYVTTSTLDNFNYATESYVQSVAQGLHIHPPVEAATTANLADIIGDTVIYNNAADGVGATLTLSSPLTTLDGWPLSDGERVLIKNQADAEHNGIYNWATGGTILTRSIFEDHIDQFGGGDFVFVAHGDVNGDTGWVQTEEILQFGTSVILFNQFAGAGQFQAGAGLTLTGNIFSISTSYVGQNSITTLGTVATGVWNATAISPTSGGTGLSSLGTAGQVLLVNTAGDGLVYSDIDGGSY